MELERRIMFMSVPVRGGGRRKSVYIRERGRVKERRMSVILFDNESSKRSINHAVCYIQLLFSHHRKSSLHYSYQLFLEYVRND